MCCKCSRPYAYDADDCDDAAPLLISAARALVKAEQEAIRKLLFMPVPRGRFYDMYMNAHLGDQIHGKSAHTFVADDVVWGPEDQVHGHCTCDPTLGGSINPGCCVNCEYADWLTGPVVVPNGTYEPKASDWVSHPYTPQDDAFARGGYTHTSPPMHDAPCRCPSDDELYGKAKRDEKGQPYASAQSAPRIDRVNHDLSWFKAVNAGMKELGLNGDEPYAPEPQEQAATPRHVSDIPRYGDCDLPGWDFNRSRNWRFFINGNALSEVVAYNIDGGWIEQIDPDRSAMHGSTQRKRYYGVVTVRSA